MNDSAGPPWKTLRLRDVASKIQDGTHFSPVSGSGPFRYLTSRNIRFGHMDLTGSGWLSESEHRAIYRRCDPRQGDLLLTKDGANTGNATINPLDEQFSLLSSVAMLRFNPAEQVAGFYLQYILSPRGQAQLKDQMSGNAITRVTLTKIKNLAVPVPPLGEQRRITEILDAADNAILSMERLVAKLEEAKRGLLHDLLTRGVDEFGHLRGTDGLQRSPLGLVPKEWDIWPLGKILTSIDAGQSPDLPDRPAPAGEWGVLKVSAIRPDGLQEHENKVVTRQSLIDPSIEVRHGDLLISRANTPALVGLVCYVRNPRSCLMLSDKSLRLNVDSGRAIPEFISYLLQAPSSRRQIEISGTGSSGSMKNISQGEIRSLVVPLPGFQEQSRILIRVEGIRARLDVLRRELSKRRLLKQGLMDDLLTGRVRVGAVA
jgi:type I restriction enzyme, S subunit